MNRRASLQQLQTTQEWDVIIIGGGATGLGAAVDSANRGFKTLLIEQADFAKGTSSKATKLIHGGVRYMAQGNIKLVREALKERALLLQNAKHVCKELDFIIPCYSIWQKIKYGAGLKLYDFLAGKYSLGKTRIVGRKKAKEILQLPNIKNIKGAVLYKDGQFDDARLAINIAQTAIQQGAILLNYIKATAILKEKNKITGIQAVDFFSKKEFTLNCKILINATGVFVNDIFTLDNPLQKKLVTPSQGVHLVIAKKHFTSTTALMIPKTKDGRVLFAVPWHNVVILGTTDTPVAKIELEPSALQEEIDFILSHFNAYTNSYITSKEVQSIFVGLRPLVKKQETKKTSTLSRDHIIMVSESNLISVIGGKWTTYRKMGEDIVNKAIEVGKLERKECATKNLTIYGYTDEKSTEYGTADVIIEKLFMENKNWQQKIIEPYHYTYAHIVHAVRNEMAQTVEDVLARRTRLLFLNAEESIKAATNVAAIMASEMQLDKSWEQQQVGDFTHLSQKYLLS